MSRSYSDLIKLKTFEERFDYLWTPNEVGNETFGSSRYLNQIFYHSPEWRSFRHKVITRDNGCDLGIPDLPIQGKIYIHHINPLTKADVINRSPALFDLENVIACTYDTHKAIHYGNLSQLNSKVIERVPGDTCPWK